MDKVSKMILGEGNLSVRDARVVIADNYNIIVDALNEIIDIVDSLEGSENELTANELAAIQESNTPSALNPIATLLDLVPLEIPYYKYAVTVTQTGANAPVATILNNTLGTVTWARTSAGTYTATTTGLFTLGKTLPNSNVETITVESTGAKISAVRTSANVITITTKTSEDTLTDGLLTDRYIEFIVYK